MQASTVTETTKFHSSTLNLGPLKSGVLTTKLSAYQNSIDLKNATIELCKSIHNIHSLSLNLDLYVSVACAVNTSCILSGINEPKEKKAIFISSLAEVFSLSQLEQQQLLATCQFLQSNNLISFKRPSSLQVKYMCLKYKLSK